MKKTFDPGRVGSYFHAEWRALLIVTISGIFYNIGLLAGPIFEGKLAQCLLDIFGGSKTFRDMAVLAVSYVLTIAAVQIARYIKRFYVRRFANNTNRRMRQVLYRSLVHKSKAELEGESVGSVITKAVTDVDACVEGMRKFTTEVFDTGVAMVGYVGMLLFYDWKLALLCLIFPPISYAIAEKMKVVVQRTGAAYKESAARLSSVTMDRGSNSITYRVYGCEAERNASYEEALKDYESAAVRSQVWSSALPPLYQVLSMVSVMLILYLGGQRVQMNLWDIGIFTAYLSCYGKLSLKSSKAAKLFNSVQQAEVSWKRIRPLMQSVPDEAAVSNVPCQTLFVEKLGAPPVFEGLSFTAEAGQMIGITGPVASGKSTLGKAFLHEREYVGTISFGGAPLSSRGVVGYLGHDPELFSDTIENNVLMGSEDDVWKYLKAVELDEEVKAMPDGIRTKVGTGGLLLSGGQQQRLALARTLAHLKPILVLDDPFSALDRDTERKVYANLRQFTKNNIVLLISHRLYLFPELEQVIWLENGRAEAADHDTWMKRSALYRELYQLQTEGDEENEK